MKKKTRNVLLNSVFLTAIIILLPSCIQFSSKSCSCNKATSSGTAMSKSSGSGPVLCTINGSPVIYE
jgi:hypothetical protein